MLDVDAVSRLYQSQAARHEIGRERLGRALTLGEKILFSHLDDPRGAEFERKKSFLDDSQFSASGGGQTFMDVGEEASSAGLGVPAQAREIRCRPLG